METSIASSPFIGRKEVFNPTYESNAHFDWGLEGCAMEMEVDKEEGAMDIVVSEPRSQQEGDTSTFGIFVRERVGRVGKYERVALSDMSSIACNWTIYRDSIAKNWDKAIQKFKEIIGNDVATKEVIDVD
ncbi:hypothetical protein RHMOL_Rhmol06G0101200 [Rhododendron molle]|uniref:Uncharacterized protein n=1 Tax=Rhododendron molle TaxID=49168 RepID=A0ACC0NC45_RHOML|nr:hypothetical protein RHMOL_Rhmol06G0101200 [Rhododendron molle]